MRLERLLMVNWCRHARREIRFHPGLNAFLGGNGKGKSGALSAVLFALIGDFSRNDGKKDANITQHVPEDAPAFVELELTHGDFRCVLTRYLRGGQTSLAVYGSDDNPLEKPVRGDNKVTARLLELLHTSDRVLSDYVFVAQGAMFAPFAATTRPADRAVAFQRLFGVEQAEALWEAIGERLATTPVTAVPDVSGLEQQSLRADVEVQNLSTELQPIKHLIGWVRETDPDAEVLRSHAAAAKAGEDLRRWTGVRLDRIRERRKLMGEYRETKEHIRLFSGAVATGELAEGRHFDTLHRKTVQDAQDQRLQVVARSLAHIEEELARLYDPVPPAHGLSRMFLDQALREVEAAIISDSRYVNSFGTDSRARCPTCGTPVESFRGALDEARERIKINNESKPLLQGQLDGVLAYETALRTATQSRSNLQSRQRELVAEQAAAAGRVLVTDDDAKSAQVALDHLTAWRGELLAARRVGDVLKQKLLLLRADCQQARLAVYKAKQVSVGGCSDEETSAAEVRLRDKAVLATQAAVLQSRLTTATQTRTQIVSQLESVRQQVAEAQRQVRVRERLSCIREVLHRDNLPRLVCRRQLERLGAVTNEVLASFGSPMRLVPQEGLSYRADFTDGRQQPLTRLSGGEQVLTALAFRIATNATFAKSLGILCLDEPTAYLDADNIGCLDVALGQLRQLSRDRGLQCIIITHENLGHLFDHVETFD